MFFLKNLGMVLLLIILDINAADKYYPHGGCPEPKSRQDIIDCALTLHPQLQKGLLKIDSASALYDQAAQIPNPSLSSRFVRNNDLDTSELETNLNFTVELGGKRGARKKRAQAIRSLTVVNQEELKARVKSQVVIKLHRLRQVLEEKNIYRQANLAFKKVMKQLRDRPRLSAEQEGALTLFEIAYEENKVIGAELFEEERSLEHFFHVVTGHALKEIKALLPTRVSRWPKIVKEKDTNSVKIEKLKSMAKLAHQNLEVQKSKAWPDLKIGPSLAIEKEGHRENRMVGLNITLPLPLFNQNGGGQKVAHSEVLRARKTIKLEMEQEEHERFEQFKIYKSAVSVLTKSLGPTDLEKKHRRIEGLYMRGVVSSSLFLDSLKQKLSYTKLRNKRELRALSALWQIYKLDGIVLKEEI